MKQHITVEQLEQLTDEQVCNLNTLMKHEWALTNEELQKYSWQRVLEDTAKFCNIGKMIEMLEQSNCLRLDQLNIIPGDSDFGFKWVISVFHDIDCPVKHYESVELVDALWQGVKKLPELS